MRIPPAIALVMLLSVVPAGGEQEPDPWTTERFQWSEAIGSRSRLVLVNEHGDLRTRDAGDDRIEVVANLQSHVADRRHPRVDVSEIDGGLRISVVYSPASAPDGVTPQRDADWPADPSRIRGRVDVTVLVPAGVDVEARTGAGLLELKGIDGTIDARSESGDVVVSTARPARVVAERGGVQALFKGTDWSAPSELRTGNGALAVWLPPEASVEVVGETSGEIATDFTLAIDYDAESRRKRARAVIGGGAAELELHSSTGPIKILRSH